MLYQAHPDSDLTSTQMATLENLLKLKKDEILAQEIELQKEITQKQDCSIIDSIDAAKLREDSIRATNLFKKNRAVLDDIERAFNRLKAGTYGICTVTGEPIPYERLKLVPWATFCVEERG